MIYTRNCKIPFRNQSGIDQVANIELITLNNFNFLESYIDKYMSEIVRGPIYPNELDIAKKEIVNLMSNKTSKQQLGLVGEFFTHVVLRNLDFKQESVFNNLEESSLKKGFDGLYSKGKSYWIAESKSGDTIGLVHKNKINEALNDLKDKLEGKTNNNPFKNATYHMVAARKKPNKKLQRIIIELSELFTKGEYPVLDAYNVIPISTLFVGHKQTDNDIFNDISPIVSKLKYNNIIMICIDNSLYADFLTYLGN
ncbi:MAG: hypothetical protein RBQ97_01425 [Acholeplasma sp.]|jgi:hypothetical protein|nr:hypothetical protein [Acholeplasma sp.]